MVTTRGPAPHELDEEDPVELLRMAIDEEGTASAVARRLGLSPAYILDVRHGNRPASPRLLKAMGLQRRIVRIGDCP